MRTPVCTEFPNVTVIASGEGFTIIRRDSAAESYVSRYHQADSLTNYQCGVLEAGVWQKDSAPPAPTEGVSDAYLARHQQQMGSLKG